jgi:A/G-specific adenine glycosylase
VAPDPAATEPIEPAEPAIEPGRVLAWGVPRMRDLPWRRTRDPWAILVAEVMLQQTRVERVVPKWTAFLDAYDSPRSCADAPLGDVLRLWHGLGYPRRARNLHSAAIRVTQTHMGRLPDTLDDLLALPGIGPYTARAVLAFAFERDVAVVDTNIARILARTSGERLTPKRAQAYADSLVPHGEGWTWNQVLMDLGAVVCRPRPDCGSCPVGSSCAWAQAGRPGPDPAEGSAGVSVKQAPYDGSDRQRRGLVMAAVNVSPAPAAAFDRAIVDGLVRDGLIERDGDLLRLPR